jgi:hypothetical protein
MYREERQAGLGFVLMVDLVKAFDPKNDPTNQSRALSFFLEKIQLHALPDKELASSLTTPVRSVSIGTQTMKEPF